MQERGTIRPPAVKTETRFNYRNPLTMGIHFLNNALHSQYAESPFMRGLVLAQSCQVNQQDPRKLQEALLSGLRRDAQVVDKTIYPPSFLSDGSSTQSQSLLYAYDNELNSLITSSFYWARRMMVLNDVDFGKISNAYHDASLTEDPSLRRKKLAFLKGDIDIMIASKSEPLVPDIAQVNTDAQSTDVTGIKNLSRAERKKRKEDRIAASALIHSQELEATDRINALPEQYRIRTQLALIEDRLQAYYRSLPENTEADVNLETARRLRLIPFRIIGHRFAMNLIPSVIEVLADPTSIDWVIEDESFKAFRDPYATLEGQRGRVHHGDEARIGAVLYRLLEPIAQQTLLSLPYEIHEAAIKTTVHFKDMARAKLSEMRETSSNSPFIVQDEDDKRTYQQRFLEYQAYNLPIDLTEMFVETNLPNQIEHVLAPVGDLYRRYDKKQTPHENQFPASLSALNWFRMLAFLRNEIGGKIEFEDRYVWKGSVGKDRSESKRKPMLSVNYDSDNENWVIYGDRAPFTASLAERPGKCPGKDIVKPRDSDLARCDQFISAILNLTGTKFPTHLMTEGISEPDVISVYALAVVNRLRELGVITLTQKEFARFLGPEQQSDGVVVYVKPMEEKRVIE